MKEGALAQKPCVKDIQCPGMPADSISLHLGHVILNLPRLRIRAAF